MTVLATAVSTAEVLTIVGGMSFTFVVGWVLGALVASVRKNDD